MKELRNIIEAYDQADFSQRKAVLATVVKVKGSSYRNPGARMLILDNGRWIGSISGGCLEGDAMRKARKVMQTKKSMLVTYDTMDDESNTLGVGLGCNGIIDVLIESIDPEDKNNPIEMMKKLLTIKDLAVMALVYKSEDPIFKAGERLMLLPEGEWVLGCCNSELKSTLEGGVLEFLKGRRSGVQVMDTENGCMEILFEIVEPAIQLLIFGAGFDAKPVVNLAKAMGWHVRITDECVAHIAPAHFPAADDVVMCKRDYVHRDLEITPFTAVILMSHNYHYDLEVIRQIKDCQAAYVGILGPKKRTEKLFNELEKEGIQLSGQFMGRLHTPIGLDIGAETPEEIAMSILSEILAKFSGRSGGYLKYHKGPIHKRQGTGDEVFKQVYLNTEDDDSQEKWG